MEPNFWLEKWQKQEIGFHQDEVNLHLKANLSLLNLSTASHILVPLCGKSLDLVWLVEQGYKVTGVELSPLAVSSFFQQSQWEYHQVQQDNLSRYISRDGQLSIIQGDFLQLDCSAIDPIDAIYDRAAMIALPPQLRKDYFSKVKELLSRRGQALVITIEYPVDGVEGPPFSVSQREIETYFSSDFSVKLLTRTAPTNLPSRFEEARIRVEEKVYHLQAIL